MNYFKLYAIHLIAAVLILVLDIFTEKDLDVPFWGTLIISTIYSCADGITTEIKKK